MMSFAVLLVLFATARAAPQVSYPLNAQFPPVARVGKLYTFQFASTTFQPDPDKLQYSLIGNPSWLSLSGRNRTLWGTPGSGDVGKATFSISAAGEAGAVTTMESTLLVSNDRIPTTNDNISQSLASAGLLLGPRSLTIAPSKPLDLKFPLDTFQDTNKNFSYHVTLADHTPLPAWISFDASSLHFAGTTPPLTSGPQSFDIVLIAANADGYALASISFTLVVSNHQFLFDPMQQTLHFSKGERVAITDLRSQLSLDNKSITDGDVVVTADIPSWLTFNNRTLEIAGLPPSGLMSQDVTVTAKDEYGDSANKLIHLMFKSAFFAEEMGTLNITAGQYFEYQIPRSMFAGDDVTPSVDFGSLGKWLQFNPATLTIHGTLPEDYAPEVIEAKLSATSRDGKTSDSQVFHLQIFGSGTNTYPHGDDSTTGSSPPSESRPTKGAHEGSRSLSGRRAGIVIGSIFGALVALIIILSLARCLRRRKDNAKGYISPRGPRSPRKSHISRPFQIEEEWGSLDRTLEDVEKGEDEEKLLERTPDHPPQLALDLEKTSHSASSSIGDPEANTLDSFDRSIFGLKVEAGPSHRPADSMRIPTEMARRESEKSYITSKHRRTTPVYRGSHRSSGPPLKRRLTGKGHGRHTYSPSHSSNNFSSFRKHLSTSSATSTSTSILNTGYSALPQPSTARHTTQLTTPTVINKQRSIRLVSSTCASLVDRSTLSGKSHKRSKSSVRNNTVDERSIDQKRHSWIKKRASTQSPFFGANTSRMSSSSYKSPPYKNESGPPTLLAPYPLGSDRVAPLHEDHNKENTSNLPDVLRIRKPSETPSVELQPALAGSLRKPPTQRSFTRHTTNIISTDRVYKRYDRPSTAVLTRPVYARRASTRESLRAAELKTSLNSLTGSKIYEDAEMSESQYSSEEEEIEEYSKKRATIRPNQYTLPPLNLKKSRSRRESNRESKEDSKPKNSTKRDPTPYARALEHGGKENRSSTYNLEYTKLTAKAKGKATVTSIATSPERPGTAMGHRPALHTRAQSHTTTRSSTQRQSRNRSSTISGQTSNKSRHSRSMSTTTQGRDRSRTQSSAYPYFESISSAGGKRTSQQSSKGDTLLGKNAEPFLFERDLSGNIINYGLEEDPKIEELRSDSIGFRTSGGQITSSARESRLLQLTQKRETTIGPRTPSRHLRGSHSIAQGLGLSLLGGPLGRPEDTPVAESERGRERTPLSILADANGASPEHSRVVGSRGKKAVSAMAEGDEKGSWRGRRTWRMGSWKPATRGRYWEREAESASPERDDRESKAFL